MTTLKLPLVTVPNTFNPTKAELEVLIKLISTISPISSPPTTKATIITFLNDYDWKSLPIDFLILRSFFLRFLDDKVGYPLLPPTSRDFFKELGFTFWVELPNDLALQWQAEKLTDPDQKLKFLSANSEGHRKRIFDTMLETPSEAKNTIDPITYRENVVSKLRGFKHTIGLVDPPSHTLILENTGKIATEIDSQLRARQFIYATLAKTDSYTTPAQKVSAGHLKFCASRQDLILDEVDKCLSDSIHSKKISSDFFGEPITSEPELILQIQLRSQEMWWAIQQAAYVFYSKKLQSPKTLSQFLDQKIYSGTKSTSTSTKSTS